MPQFFVLELAIVVVIAYAFATQIVLPLWNNQRLFPFFRKKESDVVEKETKLVSEQLETEKLREQKEVLVQEVEKTKKRSKSTKSST